MKMRAAVLEEFGKPLEIQEVDLAEPKAGEVLVRLQACGVCHTDLYTASGADPSGYTPTVLGHEGAGVVEKVGPDVSSLLAEGDHVVTPVLGPVRRVRPLPGRPRTNLCLAIRDEQNKGHLPDGTTRLSLDGEDMRHFMGCSTFAEYTVMSRVLAREGQPRGAAGPHLPLRLRALHRPRRRDVHGGRPGGDDLRRLRRRDGRPRRGRRLPAAGSGAHRLRRPLRRPPRAGQGPGGDRCAEGRRGRRRAGPRDDRRLRRRLHLRGDRERRRDGPGRRGRPHGLGPVHRRRRGRQGRDARHRPPLPDHRPPRRRLLLRRRQGARPGARPDRPLHGGRHRRRALHLPRPDPG